MDTSKNKTIVVELPNGVIMDFVEHESGLYIYDTLKDKFKKMFAFSSLQTVRENEGIYTKREIAGVKKARKLQALMGWPSESTFRRLISDSQVLNCDVTLDDVIRANDIYGTARPLLQGKMKRKMKAMLLVSISILINSSNSTLNLKSLLLRSK